MQALTLHPATAALRVTVLALALFGLAACGNDDGTGPGGSGEVQMIVKDDPGSAQASSFSNAVTRAVVAELDARRARGQTLPVRFAGSGDPAEANLARAARTGGLQAISGTITTDATASISADGETWIDLGSPNGITIDLQSSGDSTNVHGTANVEAGTYSRFRLRMQDARATIQAGSTLGTLTLTADVVISLGGNDAEVTIEHEVGPVEVSAETRTTLLLEMNSEEWADEENAQDEEASDQEVQQASRGSARSDMK